MVVYFCAKCGFVSDPNVGMKNECPNCQKKLSFLDGSLDEIINRAIEIRTPKLVVAQNFTCNQQLKDSISELKNTIVVLSGCEIVKNPSILINDIIAVVAKLESI